jgi:hypothetical protein
VRRRPGEFDTFLFADYSGAASPSAQRRSIALWRLDRGRRPRKVEGPFTRETLREAILAALVRATREGRRVLFGIDHQWSWPRDLWAAAGLAGRPWREALGALVSGGAGRPPLGPAHVFPAAFNAWAAEAIFHCRVRGLALAYGLPTLAGWRGDPVRLAERAMAGAKPATRLGGAGAVAGQTLAGLVELHRLLEDARRRGVAVLAWPMDALVDDGDSHLGCEIYPSFCRPRRVRKTDDADARWTCLWASRADLARLLDLTAAPAAVQEAARVEGWILGATPVEIGDARRRQGETDTGGPFRQRLGCGNGTEPCRGESR